MPYVEDITEPLIGTLTHTAGLPVQKLAGHAANLDFWIDEVKHATQVIDGYNERFKKLQEGQKLVVEQNGLTFDSRFRGKPLRPGLTDDDLKELRRRLIDSADRLLSRCSKEGLVSEEKLAEHAERLNLDFQSLKSKKSS